MNAPLRLVIVDDEPPAVERLQRMLGEIPGNRVVATFTDPLPVADACRREQPDVVLLDIEMPGLSGVNLARQLSALEWPPLVVFVTAYETYAVDAFDIEAVDYLVKPVARRRLQRALGRTAARLGREDHQAVLISRVGEREQRIPLDDIRALVAEDKYTVAHYGEGSALLSDSLNRLEADHARRFVRVHRKALVARRFVQGMHVDQAGRAHVAVEGVACELPVSRRNRARVRRLLRQGAGE